MKNTLKNAFYNAIGFLFPVVIALFTTPYIVHKLSPEIYGIYILAISLMGLMSFMDLGFGQGIIKFVSHYEAKKNYEKINKIIAVSIFINSIMGLVGAIIIYILSPFLVELFKVKPEQYGLAILSFRLISIGFFLTLLNGVFSNIPRALQRYDMAVKIQNFVWFISVMSTVALLYFGKGLVEIFVFYILFQFIGLMSYAYYSMKIIPIKYSIFFDRKTFREIFGFSVYTAINSITGNMVFRVDKMIISYFLGTQAVTYYQIPFMIVQMSNSFVTSIIQFLFPMVSQLNSINDYERLKQIYFRITRYVIVLSLIITITLIFLSSSFINLWMGNDFALKSASILPIIAVVSFFVTISNVGYYFYNGLGKSRINMISSFVSASCYLLAAFVFVEKFGLIGAAISFFFVLVPYPFYIYLLNGIIGIDLRLYINMLGKALFVLLIAYFVEKFIGIMLNIPYLILLGILVVILSIYTSIILNLINKDDIIWLKRKVMSEWVL